MTGEGRKGAVWSWWSLTNAIAFSLSPQSAGTESVRLKLALGKGWQGYGFKSYPLECARQLAQTNRLGYHRLSRIQPQSGASCLNESCIHADW